MAGETRLIANSVPLDYIHTAEVDAEAVTDPLSGKDLLYTRRTIRVEAIVAPGSATALPGETPAATMRRVEHLLSLPRRPFVYSVDGVVLYQSDGLDPAGGPVPVPPKITQVTANSFRIAYALSFCTNDCPEGAARRIWSSLRWTQDQEISEDNYSTITTAGKLVLNADLLRLLTSADQLRGLVVPPVPPNFVRKSKYGIAADGLTLDFTLTDTEYHVGPPVDASKLTGHLRHYFIKGGGNFFAEVELTLDGRGRNTPKPRLMATAIAIAFDRLKKAVPPGAAGKMTLKEGSMSEAFEKNRVQVKLLALVPSPLTVGNKNVPGFVYDFARDPLGSAFRFAGTGQLPGGTGNNGAYVSVPAKDGAAGPAEANARAQADQQARQQKPPGLGILAIDLSQWGSRLLGCNMPGDPAAAGIGPDLYGSLPAFRLIAAAFRDPCLDNTVALATAAKLQYKQEFQPASNPTLATPANGPIPPTASTLSQVMVLNGMPPVVPAVATSVVDPYPGVWEESHIECEYTRRQNTAVLPRTVSGVGGVQVSWANPELFLRTTWTMSKAGGPPTVPVPDPKDDNAVLVDGVFMPESVDLGPDGVTLWYTVAGCFDYQFLDPSKVNVTAPRVPWLNVKLKSLPAFPTDADSIFADTPTNTLRSQGF